MTEKRVRKGRTPKPETTSVLPNFSAEQGRRLQQAIDRKGHLEYLCFMLLSQLNRLPLEQCLKIGVSRGIVDQDSLKDFFGDRKDEEVGSCEAEGHTIESLLSEWREATNDMMGLMAGRG